MRTVETSSEDLRALVSDAISRYGVNDAMRRFEAMGCNMTLVQALVTGPCDKVAALVGKVPGSSWPAYAWPGGYPIGYVVDDGETLCASCLNTEESVHFGGDADGWRVDGAIAYGANVDYPTDSDEQCAHCHAVICEALS